MKKILYVLPILLVMLTACPRKSDNIDPVNTSGEHRIGYLFYTSFISEYNPQLFAAFEKFKKEKITDLIIDLRYNHGGSIHAASYLASLITRSAAVKSRKVFSQLDYNSFLNQVFGDDRKYYLGVTSGSERNPLDANLDLGTVYIIATGDSYSAAELLTFCLRPYMKVVHVGEGTGGKFTASFTVHAFDGFPNVNGQSTVATIYNPAKMRQSAKDSLKNWAMQPIVAIYRNAENKDFSVAGKLLPDVAVTSLENDPSGYKSIGDPNDYLVAATIAKIVAPGASGWQEAPTVPRMVTAMQPTGFLPAKERIKTESVQWKLPQIAETGPGAPGQINTVSQFVYDGLSDVYKWADNMKSKIPTAADNDPEKYFKSLLHPLDTEHQWSWITNNVQELLAEFSGEPVDFGWGLTLLWADAARTKIYAVVKYVYPNSPAANAGIVRGQVITRINGVDITAENNAAGYYGKLFSATPISVTVQTMGSSNSVSLAPARIFTNPVLKDTVYVIKK